MTVAPPLPVMLLLPLFEESLIFLATLSPCATISNFHRKGLPNTEAGTFSNLPPSFSVRPILIERKALEPQVARQDTATIGLELVPWKPCDPALLLQLWLEILEAASNKSAKQAQSVLTTNSLGEDGQSTFIPANSEIQTSQNEPGPLSMTVSQTDSNRPRHTVSLPDRVSNALSPIIEKSVRCSSRLNMNDGFCAVCLDREATKKRKISVVNIDGRTGEAGPVPLVVLQGWGIDCGIAPSELSNEALLHTLQQLPPK